MENYNDSNFLKYLEITKQISNHRIGIKENGIFEKYLKNINSRFNFSEIKDNSSIILDSLSHPEVIIQLAIDNPNFNFYVYDDFYIIDKIKAIGIPSNINLIEYPKETLKDSKTNFDYCIKVRIKNIDDEDLNYLCVTIEHKPTIIMYGYYFLNIQ